MITLSKDFITSSGDVLKAGTSYQVAEWYNFGGGCFIVHPNPKSLANQHIVGISSEYISPPTKEELKKRELENLLIKNYEDKEVK